ncbi:MAG: hypothetical protein IPJ65_02700 [Archangiaceae bacterium]|nr:hypothetical protein [Archangiaceae bacterium]
MLLCGCPHEEPKTGLPCDVAAVVSQKCLFCHADPLTNSAPMSLLDHDDFTAKSSLDPEASVAQRSLLRVKQAAAPMPPSNATALTADELSLFEKWVNEGAQAGECKTNPDAGLPLDAGPPALTCATETFKPRPTTQAPGGGPEMAPGFACRACHLGQNFEGQNPFGALGMTVPYDVMGTLYAAPHEKDLCVSSAGDAGVVVEIRDSTGALVIAAPVNAAGNFYGSVAMDAGLKLPYTARLVKGAQEKRMNAAQMNGDCNQCHTALGRESAPGRITAP